MFSQAMSEKSSCAEIAGTNSAALVAVLQCSNASKSRNQGDPSHGTESELTPIIEVAERGCRRRRDDATGNRWQ